MVARSIAVTIAALALAPHAARAYRPFDSTDAAVAADDEIELELGPVGYVSTPGRHFVVAPSFILNLGFMRNWELVAQGRNFLLVDGPASEPTARFVETGLFLKGVVREGALQGRRGPSVGVELGALLPTVNGDTGAGATAIVILSGRARFGTAHLNAAVSYSRTGRFDLFGGLILEGPIGWRVRPVAEFAVEREFDTMLLLSGLVGVIARARDGLTFDTAFRLARVNEDRSWEVRVGLTWAFSIRRSR